MIYGELGIFPITTDIHTRISSFWSKLIENSARSKLSICTACTLTKHLKSKWLDNVRQLLCSYGYSCIWYSQSFTNAKWLNLSFSQKVKDTSIQKWYSSTNVSSSNNNYKLFKADFETSDYIKQLQKNYAEGLWLFALEIIDFQLR